MTTLTASAIITALAHLTPAERQRVATALAALTATGAGAMAHDAYDSGQQDWLLTGIHEALVQRGIMERDDRHQLGRLISRKVKGYPSQARGVRRMLEAGCVQPLNVIQARALGKIAANTLIRWMERRYKTVEHPENYDVTPENMLWHVAQIPTAFEHEFPGYIAARIVGFMLPHKKAKTDGEGK